MNNVYYRRLSDEEIVEDGDLISHDIWDPNDNTNFKLRQIFVDKHDRLPRMEPAHAFVGNSAGGTLIYRIEIGLLVGTSEPVSTERNIDLNL